MAGMVAFILVAWIAVTAVVVELLVATGALHVG